MIKTITSLKDLDELREQGLKSLYPDKIKIVVGMATCGLASGAKEVFDTLTEEIEKSGLNVKLGSTGCLGYCQKEPLVDVIKPDWPRLIYQEMNAEKVQKLLDKLVRNTIWKDSILIKIEEDEFLIFDEKKKYSCQDTEIDLNGIPSYNQLPFYNKQLRIATRNCGFIDPDNILEYIARGGYYSLYKVLTEYKPEQVIELLSPGQRGYKICYLQC